MEISSALTLRRFAARATEATQQIIVFRLRQEWFAIPIYAVQKVVLMGKAHGDLRGTGVSLTLYQGKELLVVDAGHRIFGDILSSNASDDASSSGTQKQKDDVLERYLVVVRNSQGELVGLPIDSPPNLRRVSMSAFTPLPPAYIAETNIQCVSSLLIQGKDEPSVFVLNPDQLITPTSTTKQLKPAL